MSELPSNHPVNMLINQYQRKVDTNAGLSPEEYQHMVLCINEYNTKLLSTPQGKKGDISLYAVPDPKCIKLPTPPPPPPPPAPAPEPKKEEPKKAEAKAEEKKEEPKKEEAKPEEKKEEAKKEEPKKDEPKPEEKKEEPKKEEAKPEAAAPPPAAAAPAAASVSNMKDGITVLLAIAVIFILALILK